MTFFLALLMTLATFASDLDTFEKTYPRDNTFCQYNGNKIELMIRSYQFRIETAEKSWGEFVFSRVEDKKPVKLPVTNESGLYRFFQGNPSSCTKAVGTVIKGELAVLFQKLNHPHKHQLVIQYFDAKNLKPLGTLHTPYLADRALVDHNSILVRTYPPARQDIQMGKVDINGNRYLYQDHRFLIWVRLDNKGFNADPAVTYENFSYKNFFKDLNHFKTVTGWQDSAKTFTNTTLYVAINHATKSKCIVLLNAKKQLVGDESWICQ
jgi:hypothetical protein